MRYAILFICVLSIYSRLAAQSGNTLKVLVRDSISHAPLVAASVAIKGHKHLHITDEKGYAIFDSVKSGEVKISVTYLGYHYTVKNVRVPDEKNVLIDLCPESFHLHETVITQQRSVDENTFSTQHKEVLSSEEIAAKRGQNISELLSEVNGVTQLNSGPNIAKPVIRGLHSNRVLMLNAGVRQEGQNWGVEHAPEIDPFVASRVEVIKGASAVEFGADAIGGVVRISPREYRNEKGVSGELNLQGMSNNRQGATSLMLEGTHGNAKQFSWRTQGTLRKAGDSKTSSYIISNTGFDEQNFSLGAAYQHKKLITEIYYSRFASKVGIFIGSHLGNVDDLNAALTREKPLVINPFTYEILRPYQNVTHDLALVKFTLAETSAGKFSLNNSVQQNHRQEYDADKPLNQALRNRPAFDLTLRSYISDLKWEHKPAKHLKGKAGISWQLQENDATGISYIIPNFNTQTLGVYAMEKWDTEKWILEAGLRYDIRWMQSFSDKRFNVFNESRTFQNVNGIFSVVRLLPKHWLLISTLSSGWRAPAINELYSNGLHTASATYEIGNRNLQPEQSRMIDVALKKETQTFSVEASVYANYIQNFIYQRPDLTPTLTIRGAFPTLRFAQTNALLCGADVSASRVWFKHWQTNASVSYLYADDVSAKQPLINMPANRTKISVAYLFNDYKFLSKPMIEFKTNWVDKQRRFVSGMDYVNPPDAYLLAGFHLQSGIKISKNTMLLSFDINNLFNTAYRDYLSRFRYFTDDIGVNYVLRLSIPFEIFSTTNKN